MTRINLHLNNNLHSNSCEGEIFLWTAALFHTDSYVVRNNDSYPCDHKQLPGMYDQELGVFRAPKIATWIVCLLQNSKYMYPFAYCAPSQSHCVIWSMKLQPIMRCHYFHAFSLLSCILQEIFVPRDLKYCLLYTSSAWPVHCLQCYLCFKTTWNIFQDKLRV